MLATSSAYSQESVPALAGTIVYTDGGVVAVDMSGETRRLTRHQDIYIGDTVYTATESSAQLAMIDSAQIVLGESTIFEIREYTHEDGDNDSVVLDLIEGSFRTITGKVAKEKYRAVISNFSNIGIRGTEYEASIVEADRLLVGLYDGGVALSNFGGELDLGLNADYDYAEVRSMFSAPVGLEVMPLGLDELSFVAAVPVAEEEEATLADTADTFNPNGNLVAATNPDLVQPGQAPGQVVGDFTSATAIDASAAPTDPSAPRGQSVAFASYDISRLSTADSVSDIVGTTDSSPADGDPTADLLALAGDSTAPLTELELPLQDISLLALVTDLIQDLPVAEQVQSNNGFADLATQVAQQSGDSAGLALGLVTDVVEDVGTSANNAVEGTENLIAATTPGAPSGIAGDVLDPTLLDIVEDVIDVVVETTTTAGEAVETIAEETVETATETVETAAEETVETATETVETVAGAVEETLDETVDETVGDIVDGIAGTGEESEGESSGGLLDDLPGGSSLFAIKQAPAVKKSAGGQAWGAWNTPVPTHIAQSLTISAGDYSVDLIPTEIANLTGSYSYSNVTGFEGSGSAGSLTNVLAGFDVDFNTGVIANGMLSVAVEDSQHWLLGFDGRVDQGIADLNSLGGTVTDLTSIIDSLSAIDGTLSGAFTGEHGEAFVGGFELLDLHNTMNTVDGIYTVER